MEINWLAVFAAAISSFVLGGLWYGPLFARAWMQAAGLDEASLKQRNMPLVFAGAFALSVLASASFAIFLGPEVDATTGALYGATAGLCWVAASFAINYLFENKPIALFAINGGYHALQFTLIGLILGALR